MPRNLGGTSGSSGSDGIFPSLLVNVFAARINSSANNFNVYNSVSTSSLFKINGDDLSATFYCDLNVIGNASFTSVSNVEVANSMISLATDNTVSDLIDIGFYGQYNNSGIKYRGMVKNIELGRWILFNNITTQPSSIII